MAPSRCWPTFPCPSIRPPALTPSASSPSAGACRSSCAARPRDGVHPALFLPIILSPPQVTFEREPVSKLAMKDLIPTERIEHAILFIWDIEELGTDLFFLIPRTDWHTVKCN